MLYLSGDAEVAYANGLAIVKSIIEPVAMIEDLNDPESYFEVQEFAVKRSDFVDAVTLEGRAELHLPERDVKGENYGQARAIGRTAYDDDENGIVSASAVHHSGEELAIFDLHVSELARMQGKRRTFAQWRADRSAATKKGRPRKSRSSQNAPQRGRSA